jgi:8-oxo-dGTP diphosphatase
MPNTVPDVVHVAVGVVVNRDRHVLVAKRHDSQHQGGLWEFPGGKVAAGESVQQALKRELQEEVNITVRECAALLKIPHDYGDKKVLLDVWYVQVFAGEARGCEGQPVRWVSLADMAALEFPAANQAILETVRNLLADRD